LSHPSLSRFEVDYRLSVVTGVDLATVGKGISAVECFSNNMLGERKRSRTLVQSGRAVDNR